EEESVEQAREGDRSSLAGLARTLPARDAGARSPGSAPRARRLPPPGGRAADRRGRGELPDRAGHEAGARRGGGDAVSRADGTRNVVGPRNTPAAGRAQESTR